MPGTCPHSEVRQVVSNGLEELNDVGAPGPMVAKKSPKAISITGLPLPSVCHLILVTAAVGHFYVRCQHPVSLEHGFV